jgi:hypothetical protein
MPVDVVMTDLREWDDWPGLSDDEIVIMPVGGVGIIRFGQLQYGKWVANTGTDDARALLRR